MGRNSGIKYKDLQLKYIHQARENKKINDLELINYLALLKAISFRLPQLFPDEFKSGELFWVKVNLSSKKSYGKAIKAIREVLDRKISLEKAEETLGLEYRIKKETRQDYNEALSRYEVVEDRYIEKLVNGEWQRYGHPKVFDDYDKRNYLLFILKEHLTDALCPHFQSKTPENLNKIQKEDKKWVKEEKKKERQEEEKDKRIKLRVTLRKIGLTPQQATVILKETLENKNLTTIAEDLKISVTAVKKRKDKAWEKIRMEAKEQSETQAPGEEEMLSLADEFLNKVFPGKSGKVKKIQSSEKTEEFLDNLIKGAEQ